MRIFEMSFDSTNLTDSEKLPKKIDGCYYDIMGEKEDINLSEPSFVGDIIIGVKAYSEKWLFKVCGEKLYFAPVYRSAIYEESPVFYNNPEEPFKFENLIKENLEDIEEFVKSHYLEFDVVCGFSEDLFVRINSDYQGNLFRKVLIKCEDHVEEWFYQITHWDGWFSILLEPFIEFNKDNLFKKTPLKLNVINHHYEIKDKILEEAYEFDFESKRHATKGDQLIEKHKNKIYSFKMDNLEIIVNPDGGNFDYDSLFDSQPKIRRYTKSDFGCTYITHYKVDTHKDQSRIIPNYKIAKSLINYKSKPIQRPILNKKIKKQEFESSINKLLEDYKEDILVTIVGGFNNEDLLKKGSIFQIEKEPDNSYDMEAIAVKYDDETIAYIANSVSTVVKGTMSAGRIYDKFNNEGKVEIILGA